MSLDTLKTVKKAIGIKQVTKAIEKDFSELIAKEDGTRHYIGNSRELNLKQSGPWSFYKDPAYYFTDAAARMLAMKFYDQLASLAENGAFKTARSVVRQYGSESAKIWQELRKNLGDSTVLEG